MALGEETKNRFIPFASCTDVGVCPDCPQPQIMMGIPHFMSMIARVMAVVSVDPIMPLDLERHRVKGLVFFFKCKSIQGSQIFNFRE